MKSRTKVVVASSNQGKIEEIIEILSPLGFKFLTKSDFGDWPGKIEEPGHSYLENALIKARAIAQLTGIPALSDDSGLEVDALDGAPGIRSARFAGDEASDEENNRHLAELLDGVATNRRGAHYTCVAVVVFPDRDYVAAHGVCEGRIASEPRGSGGFGYDPWFIPAGGSRTMAELSPVEKHAISHRGIALRELAAKLPDS